MICVPITETRAADFLAAISEAEQVTDAIEHYRLGLARDHTSPAARDTWSQAWRLMAGLLPRGGRFLCGNGC